MDFASSGPLFHVSFNGIMNSSFGLSLLTCKPGSTVILSSCVTLPPGFTVTCSTGPIASLFCCAKENSGRQRRHTAPQKARLLFTEEALNFINVFILSSQADVNGHDLPIAI